jgi:hypothetical protein
MTDYCATLALVVLVIAMLQLPHSAALGVGVAILIMILLLASSHHSQQFDLFQGTPISAAQTYPGAFSTVPVHAELDAEYQKQWWGRSEQ